MAKMSQKELLEEGFSDKIRGIAKAAATGVKQAAQQGIHLDTGQLVKGMATSYKDEQPIAVLKKELANDPSIDIVKINKKGIKKQQATNNKSFFGRIVGPKSITLIPFLGVRYSKGSREYEGAGAGKVMEAFTPEDAEAAIDGFDRDEKGRLMGVHPDGGVKKQIKKLLVGNHGIKEGWADAFAEYARHIRSNILPLIQKTRPHIKFTYNPRAEMGGVDVEKSDDPEIRKVQPFDYRAKFESISIRDVLRLSSFIILEKETRAELARLLGFKSRAAMDDAFRDAGGKRKWMEQNPEAVKAAEALRQRKERGQDIGDKEKPKPKPKKKAAPKKKAPPKKKAAPKKEAPPKKKAAPKDPLEGYPGHEKFLASLDDKVVLDLLKLKQKIQPGLQIKFEDEKEGDTPSDFQEEMFVAEIFRTKDGLKLGDIYREGDPTDIIRGFKPAKKEEKTKLSPFDAAVSKVKKTNNLTATTLAGALKIEDKVIVDITGKPANVKLLDPDITKIKAVLIKDGVIKEGTSQKVLLRQLTSLSR